MSVGRPKNCGSIPGSGSSFVFSRKSTPTLGFNQPPTQWAAEALPAALKRSGREADHSASARDKTEWSYTSTPLVCLHGRDRDY